MPSVTLYGSVHNLSQAMLAQMFNLAVPIEKKVFKSVVTAKSEKACHSHVR